MQRMTLYVPVLIVLSLFQLGTQQSCGGDDDTDLTWYRDVYPVTHYNCESCHQTGGIAPFSMESYESAAPYADAMAAAVSTGLMPPWMPSETCQTFENARVLSEEEKDIIIGWSRQGAEAGDPADAPDYSNDPVGGLLWVDATLDSGAAYTPTGDYVDEYRCFVLDPELDEDRWLIGYQVRPGEAFEVHHVLLYETDLAEAEALDAEDETAGWLCFGGPGTSSSSLLGAFAPGTPATEYPQDTGIRMTSGKAVVMQIHYNLSNGEPLPDLTQVDLQFASDDVKTPAQYSLMKDTDFEIPPFSHGYSASTSLTLNTDLTLWGIFPHMHELGQQITVVRSTDAGDECLIDIPQWDFHWQQGYFYDYPQGLPVLTGEKVTLTCTWNNDSAEVVTWGEGTEDEMCLAYFYVTAYPLQ